MLASKGPQHVGELADVIAVHPSTATRLCDRLVAKQLVSRTVSKESRRETVISLSPKGRDLVQRVTALRRSELVQIVDRIPESARAATIAALSAFSEAAGEVPDQSWSLGWP